MCGMVSNGYCKNSYNTVLKILNLLYFLIGSLLVYGLYAASGGEGLFYFLAFIPTICLFSLLYVFFATMTLIKSKPLKKANIFWMNNILFFILSIIYIVILLRI